MAGLLGAYSGLSNMSRSSGLAQRQSMYNLNKDVNLERESEEEKRRKRESAGGMGRVAGIGGGLLAALLTGGLASPLVTGALVGAGSSAGRAIGSNQRKVGTGKFDIAQDEESDRMYKDSMWTSGLQDALTAYSLAGMGGLMQNANPGAVVGQNASAMPPPNYMSPALQYRQPSSLMPNQWQLPWK